MNQTAELFDLDNVRRFRELWDDCTPTERDEISRIVRQEMCKDHDTQVDGIIDYLNQKKAGRGFEHTDVNRKFILDRLAEGYSEKDLKAVVDRKVAQWKDDPKMAQYLRPATLFNAEKFNQYVGELGTPIPMPKSAWAKIPYDNNDLWPWAQRHGYSNPGTLTYSQYRSQLKSEVTKRVGAQ